jgi:hypothetical protein
MLSLSSLEDRWKTDWAKVYQSIYRMPYSDVEFSLDGDGLEMGIWEIPGKDVYKIIILNHSWNETHGILYIRKKSFKIDYCSSEYELIGTNRCGISLGRKGVCIFDIQYIGK